MSPSFIFVVACHKVLKKPLEACGFLDLNCFQTELMVEICSTSLVRTIGKVLVIKFS